MYAKAVAVREALEARTTRAEAERAAAESSLQQARTQVTTHRSLHHDLPLLEPAGLPLQLADCGTLKHFQRHCQSRLQ